MEILREEIWRAHVEAKALCVFISNFLKGESMGADMAPSMAALPIALIYIIVKNECCI